MYGQATGSHNILIVRMRTLIIIFALKGNAQLIEPQEKFRTWHSGIAKAK
jgi:hypothetical protein